MRKRLKLALIGKDVSKSDSPKIHRFILEKFGVACDYELISVPKDGLDGAFERLLKDFDGFNVTIPYKRDASAYLNEVKDDGLAFGSVNTVVTEKRVGYNTDGIGFMRMLNFFKVDVLGKKTLLLGAGGAGRSVALALKRAGAIVYAYRRNQSELKEFCDELGVFAADKNALCGYDVVVNATGVGMQETEGSSPVEKEVFKGAAWAVDLIYHPKETEFLRQAKGTGCKTLNGAAMLFYQAYYSDCYYLNRKADGKEADELYLAYRKTFNEGEDYEIFGD